MTEITAFVGFPTDYLHKGGRKGFLAGQRAGRLVARALLHVTALWKMENKDNNTIVVVSITGKDNGVASLRPFDVEASTRDKRRRTIFEFLSTGAHPPATFHL